MPCWYYSKKELKKTPSILAGMPFEKEMQYRREGARFILQVGNKMGLRYETMATGVVYYHRFYMVHTFQQFPHHVTACCCLFLAGKVEETPKKCKDIMKTAKGLMDEESWAEFGADPREEVMTLERILLQTIKFDFIVEHPYTYLLKYAKCLKSDKRKLHNNMVQMAWTFVNDSLCTTLCLQWEPEIIAIALMHLAGKLSKFEVTDWTGRNSKHQKWWDMYVEGISMDLLEDICHQVLDLYAPSKAEGSTSKLHSAPPIAPAASTTPKKVPEAKTPPICPPPAKKAKKEESKAVAKPPPVTETVLPQPYSYASYQYPAGYPAGYPQVEGTAAAEATRYLYSYPPQTTPQASQGPTPPQVPPPQAPPPPTYQPPSTHYAPPPPTTIATTQAGSSSHFSAHPPPHYTASHPPPYHSGTAATHYPPPSTTQPLPHYPPTAHGSASYYHSSSGNSAAYPSSGPYSHHSSSYSHSSRPY